MLVVLYTRKNYSHLHIIKLQSRTDHSIICLSRSTQKETWWHNPPYCNIICYYNDDKKCFHVTLYNVTLYDSYCNYNMYLYSHVLWVKHSTDQPSQVAFTLFSQLLHTETLQVDVVTFSAVLTSLGTATKGKPWRMALELLKLMKDEEVPTS